MSKFIDDKYWTLPDAGERSPNDPMYLISSDALLRILNMEQTFEKPLKKRDITEALLLPVIEAAAERGWKAAVTNGKQLLLSIEEIVEVPTAVNPHHNYGTGRELGRQTVFITFGPRFNVIGLLGPQEKSIVSIANPRLEGLFVEDGTLDPSLVHRYVDTSRNPHNQFLRPLEGNSRNLHLRCRVEQHRVNFVSGELNLETGEVGLLVNGDMSLDKYVGALISFELVEGL